MSNRLNFVSYTLAATVMTISDEEEVYDEE